MKKRIVFFETLWNRHRPLVAWYRARGYTIRVFDFTYHLKFLDWLRPLLFSGEVERIYFHPGSKAEGLGMDAAEWYYPRAAGHPMIRPLRRIFTEEEADPVFKYSISREAATYFYARLFLEKTRKEEPEAEITFLPESYLEWDRALGPWCAERLSPLEGIRIPRWSSAWKRAACSLGRWSDALPHYAGAAVCLTLIGLGRLCSSRKPEEKSSEECRVLYAIASKFQTKFGGGRRFDFLIDHLTLTKQNVAFCVDPAAEGPWTEEAGRLGYRMVRLSRYSSLTGLFRYPTRELPLGEAFRAVWAGATRIGTPDWIQQPAFSGLRTWLKEGGFLERFRFLHYVYASQYAFVPRWRNALIRRTGAQSWYYAYSNGGAFLYKETPDFAGGRDFCGRIRFWAYDNADHFVSPCSQLAEYYGKHRQKVRWYHSVGNLWSEQILSLQKSRDMSEVRSEWFPGLQPSEKVVSWFDTSFVESPHSPSTFSEAIRWYEDILRLAEESPDLRMAIKPSKNAEYYVDPGRGQQWSEPRVGRRLLEVWEKLKAHPRVRFFDHNTDPTLVVAAADLTVTFCYSSVSAEALGAGKKGIWYEPGQRWKEAWYSRHTGLTAHGYDELKSTVRTVLFKMSDAEYREYLDRRVRGVVEEFLDGKGLTRFRALLAGEEFSRGEPAAESKAAAPVRGQFFRIPLFFMRPRKGLFAGIFLLTLLTSVLEAVNVAAFFPIFQALFQPPGAEPTKLLKLIGTLSRWLPIRDPVLLAVGVLACVMALKAAMVLLRECLVAYASGTVQDDIKNNMMARYGEAPYAFFLDQKQGKLSYDALIASSRAGLLMLKIPQLLADLFKVVSIIGLMLFVLPKATLVFAALALGYAAFTRLVSQKVSYQTGRGRAVSGAEQSSITNEFLTGIRQIRVFHTQRIWLERFRVQSRIFRDLFIRDMVWLAFPRPVMELVAVLGILGFIAAGRVLAPGALLQQLPLLGVFTVALFQMLPALTNFGREKMEILNLMPDAERAYHSLTETLSKPAAGDRSFVLLKEKIRFERVGFSYPGRPPLLRDLQVEFRKGQTTAIIGPSGSGKTTVVNLLLRLFDPTQGAIRVDGADLREFEPASWLRQIGFVSQDPFITHASIAENISFGRENCSREMIERAARVANAHEFISQFPQGYETVVGDRGMKLSGGQQQRIAIARAVLLDPQILIFDEATSALDTESERQVQTAIERISRDRTVILIAHRLSTVQHADKIVYLENGGIVEEGNHRDLLKAQGRYFNLVSSLH